jgi:hypothetical protein
MSIFQRRVFAMVAMVAVGVMLGLNLASSGIERIQGPTALQNNPPAWAVQQQIPAAEQQSNSQVEVQYPQTSNTKQQANQQTITKDGVLDGKHTAAQEDYIALVPTKQPTVDKLASTTGGVLESVSHKGIEWVVSMFSSILD